MFYDIIKIKVRKYDIQTDIEKLKTYTSTWFRDQIKYLFVQYENKEARLNVIMNYL